MADLLARALAHQDAAPLVERRDLLVRWGERIRRRSEDLAKTITAGTGKPLRLARIEVERAVAVVSGTASQWQRLLPAPALLDSGRAEIHRAPIGPVLAVTPFNLPLTLAMHKLAPALLAGCPVLWKPSPKAPGVAELALDLYHQAGGEDGPLQVVQASHDEVAAWCTDRRLALLSFTGSVAVGRALQSRCSGRTVLELGGNAAVILHHVTDVAACARAVAMGACAHAGQLCISVQRIFLPAGREDLRQALIEAFRAFPAGDPWDDRTLCGPVIDDAARTRISALLAGYADAGGRCLTGGTWEGRLLAPTLIEGVAANHPLVRASEAFAPLATLLTYTDLDQALDQVDDTPFGLQAGLYCQDETLVRRAFAKLEVGTLVINDVPTRRDDRLPYGGCRDSGNGREGVLTSLDDYTQPRVLWWP